jgi:NAD/NADP transhydrogenase alpha subunit
MSEEILQRQRQTYARVLKEADVVITTAMIPNKAAPLLITHNMVGSMKKQSVIVDLAASTGGNCALTKVNCIYEVEGITIVGKTTYPSEMAGVASELLASNFAAMLETLGKAANFGSEVHWQDPIVRPATIVRGGQMLWPPPAPAPVPAPAPPLAAPHTGQPGRVVNRIDRHPTCMPESVEELIKWIQANQHELALGVGLAIVTGLGLTTTIPDKDLMHIGYFVLSCLIGHFTVAGVNPQLHTPLISVTNAISGIIVVGGMLQLQGPLLSAKVAFALASVFLSSVNIVGGFAVTHRMLEMFCQNSDENRRL